MKADVKAAWVAALRSGEYEQGGGVLNRDGKFCCLGVLCDLATKAGVTSADGGRVVFYDGDDGLPPGSVLEWADLKVANPVVKVGEHEDLMALSEVNDRITSEGEHRFNFERIADLIEAQL